MLDVGAHSGWLWRREQWVLRRVYTKDAVRRPQDTLRFSFNPLVSSMDFFSSFLTGV